MFVGTKQSKLDFLSSVNRPLACDVTGTGSDLTEVKGEPTIVREFVHVSILTLEMAAYLRAWVIYNFVTLIVSVLCGIPQVGMTMIIHVGSDKGLPPHPRNFPQCEGDWNQQEMEFNVPNKPATN